jgi:hypothetical protein
MRTLVDTGLAHRDTTRGVSYFQLTEMGQRLIYEQTARSLLYADLMHYLFFALSDEPDHNGTVSGWSWVYQTTCRLLWNARPLVPTPTKLAADLNHLLADAYPDHSGGVHPNGPRGVLAWLRALQPPFTRTYGTTQRASGRSWCSPELLMLGVARLYHQKDVPFGTPLLLDAQAMEELSALCLAEAPCLEDVLEVCLATFPFLTTHSGEWGRSAPRA